MIGGEVMADTDVGKLTASVSLDTSNLEKGINNAIKSLDKFANAFEDSQRKTNDTQRRLNARIDDNNKAIQKMTDDLSKVMAGQTRVLIEQFRKMENAITKSNKVSVESSQQMVALMVAEFRKLKDQMDITYALGQRDFGKGIKRLSKEIKHHSPTVVTSLKRIQSQADSTNNSLGKLSKLDRINSKFINLGTDRIETPKVTAPRAVIPKVNIADDLGKATAQANGLTSSLMQTWHTLSMISFQVYLFQQGLQQVSNLVQTFVAPGWEFAKAMETNEVGMAGILSSMTTLGDKELEWNEAMSISKGIIKELNIEAVKTAATTEELVGTFRALLGPGLGADFSIEEIKDFTVVGVNAVKSMGLEGRQLVQELRDLVQGGIQSASSTLATALGLTDKDIKEAKNSSEGLYKFLMKRLRGFQYSADATAETLKGLESIVTEGYTLASAEALQPIMNEYRDMLKGIQDVMFNKDDFTLRPEFVNGFKEVAEYSLMFLKNTKNIIVALEPVGEVLVKTLVPALKLVAEYSDVIVALWGSMYIGQKFGDTTKIVTDWKNVAKTQVEVNDVIKANRQQYNALMQDALNTGKTLTAEYNKRVAKKGRGKEVSNVVQDLRGKGDYYNASRLANLKQHYERLGFSAEQASKLQYEASKVIAKGNEKLFDSIIEVTSARKIDADAIKKQDELYQKSLKSQQDFVNKCALVANGIQNIGIAVSGAGVLIGWFADENDKATQEFANSVVASGMVIGAFGSIIQAIPTLKEGFEGLKAKVIELNAVLTKLGTFGSILKVLSSSVGIGLGVGAVAATAYAATHDISREEAVSRYFDSRQDKERKQAEKEQAEADKKREEDAIKKAKEMSSKLKVRENKNVGQDATVHIRSQYKKLEQELKTALAPLKELQKEYDYIYKYDLMSTQSYVESKFNLQRQAIDIEIANLAERRKIAEEQQQMADVDNFNTQIERLGVEKENLKREAVRQLVDEYKKLDDRLFNIKKEFEGLVGVSEKAFEENTVKEYGETIVRIQAELKTANEYLNKAISSGNAEEVKLWETRKQSYQDAEERLKTIISLKKLEYNATQALSEAERINLEIEEKYLAIQGKADRLEISPLNAQSQHYEMVQEHLDEYIDSYTTAIAQYEKMAEKANAVGDIPGFNKFKSQAIELRKELNELVDNIHPLQKVIQEEFIGSLSDMFQSMLWQEKTAKEALKDFAKSVMQTFTKQVFDNFASQIAGNLFNPKKPNSNDINDTINNKKDKITPDSWVELIFGKAKTEPQGLLPSMQALEVATNDVILAFQRLADAVPNTPNTPNTPNGGSGGNVGGFNFNFGNSVGTKEEGSASPTFSIGDITLPEDSLGGLSDLSEEASDASISASSLSKSMKASTGATDENTGATASDTLATATMVTTMLNATGVLGKFGTVLQGVMMAMQIAKSAHILGFADGGYISGPGTGTSDSIPARLSNGEYVVRAGAVKQLGVGFLDQLNNIDRSGVKRSSRLPKFAYAEGGYVNAEMGGETQSSTPSVTGGVAQPTVVMQMTFQSLDPEANMKLMEAQYPQIRSRLIRDLQSNSSVRTAVKGVTK